MNRRRQQGVALVVVLWLGVLLAVIASSLAASIRSDTLAARNRTLAVQARHLAEAGVVRSLLEFETVEGEAWRRGERRERRFQLPGGEVIVRMRPTSGLVDLNRGAPATLAALLEVLGVDEVRALKLADAVLDWRDRDDLRRLNGAEAADYRAAEREYGPRNGLFVHLQELRQVLGMDGALFDRLRPHLTLWSKGGAPDSRYATREILLATYSPNQETVDKYLESRETAPGTLSEGPWQLRVEARPRNGGLYRVEAVVARPPGAGWRIEDWHNAWRIDDDG